MRRLLVSAATAAFLLVFSAVFAGEFILSNGTVYRGTIASGDEDGLIIKLDSGGFTKREPYINFSQETLKELAKDSKFAKHAEAFIDEPVEAVPPKAKRPDIVVRPVEGRVQRPEAKVGFFTALTAPAGLIILGALYLGNLLAGYEVARYRNRPVALVCAVSAVLPVVGPVVFLCLPPLVPHVEETATPEAAAAELVTNPLANTNMSGGGLSLASTQEKGGAGGGPVTKTYTRNDTQFTRKFFESTFPGFFRMVLGEAEKDLVIVIKAARNEYVAKRISRISATDVHLVTLSGSEVNVGFGEMASVTVRHKDAKA